MNRCLPEMNPVMMRTSNIVILLFHPTCEMVEMVKAGKSDVNRRNSKCKNQIVGSIEPGELS